MNVAKLSAFVLVTSVPSQSDISKLDFTRRLGSEEGDVGITEQFIAIIASRRSQNGDLGGVFDSFAPMVDDAKTIVSSEWPIKHRYAVGKFRIDGCSIAEYLSTVNFFTYHS